MGDIANITLIGLLAGVLGTGLGGLAALIVRRPSHQLISFVLGFAGGIMLAIVLVDLVPEAMEIGGFIPAMLGMVAGTALVLLIDLYLPHSHFLEGSNEHASEDYDSKDHSSYVRTGAMLGLGIAMHNLPEGIAIGAGYVASPLVGLGLAITISLHNIPEGMCMATPMSIGGLKISKTLFYTGLAGVPMGIGAFIGSTISHISPLFLSIALGCAGGAMLYIIFDELIPDAQRIARGHSGTFGAVFGVILGILILSLLH